MFPGVDTTIGAQGEGDSAKFFIMTMFHNYDADNFYNKDILKNFWETCFVSDVSWDKGMRAELTMTRTHSNEGSMMHALGNNWISQTSCYWNIFDITYVAILWTKPLLYPVAKMSPVSHGAPGQHKHCHWTPALWPVPVCPHDAPIVTQSHS